VTYLHAAGTTVTVAGATVLEARSPVVWLTFPGRWHDIGRFHLPDGTVTGFYANILTPVRIDRDDWYTTDLFLDLFLTPTGRIHVLDRDELAAAAGRGWLGPRLVRRARSEAARLVRSARAGRWPPAVAREWDLARAARAAAGTPSPARVYRVGPEHGTEAGR
jgi:predicted RNA-binding protein associated with RNAse of E/G family